MAPTLTQVYKAGTHFSEQIGSLSRACLSRGVFSGYSSFGHLWQIFTSTQLRLLHILPGYRQMHTKIEMIL